MRFSITVLLACMLPAIAIAQKPVSFVESCRPDPAAPRVSLSGKVADPSGAPLVGASLALRCGNFRQDARTTGDGTYRLTAPAGSYLIEVNAPGFDMAAETVQLTQPQQRDFTLQTGTYSSIITVTEPGGFFAGSSTSATKTDAPLIEIPQSVSVVTQDQLTSRNVQTVNEAIRYTGGVDVDTYGTETRYDWINIRGFDQSTYGLCRDNSRWQSGNVSGQIDPYMIQEVDIVKGPSSVLYGQNQPGGLVNLVTKRPPSRPLRELVLNYGSFDRRQVAADFGGPLDPDGSLRYRLTGLYRRSDTQVKFVPDDRWFVAPGLTWNPSSQITWTILGDYQKDKTGWSQFLPSQGTFRPNPNGKIPRDTFTGEPGYDFFHRTQWSGGSLFEDRLNDTWTVRNTLRYSSIYYNGNTAFGGGLQDDLRTLNRFAFGNSLDLKLFTMDTNASMRAKTGIVEHSVLFGVDYSKSRSTIVSGFAVAPSIDIFHPVYGAAIPALFTYYNTRQPVSLLGLYLQDHMKIGPRWVLTLAGRHDSTDITTDDRIGGTKTKQSPTKFTERVGLTYLSEIGLAPYASYSTSFLPVTGVSFSGQPFVPTEGKQIEGGVKYQPKGSNSFLTADVFQITQTNVQVPDPNHPFNSVQQGEIRSRGYEVEAVGNLVSTLNFNAAYSHLDQTVTRTTDPTALGKRPPLAPDQLFSVAAEYTLVGGALAGLGFGAGVRFIGSRAGDAANTIEVPSYTLLDGSVRYLWRNVELQVSGTNLADKTYVAVCTSPSYCNYGLARKVIATARYHF
ncbi:MAG: TonB-dependent siderophore receptor [Acidobacteria bacterium]|nr:MAG: TonB-dependent siderophore receptor [Acidobacteriota bacterium]